MLGTRARPPVNTRSGVRVAGCGVVQSCTEIQARRREAGVDRERLPIVLLGETGTRPVFW